MAEYRVDFRFVTDSAERSIKNLKTEIKGVTKEFEQRRELAVAIFLRRPAT